MNTKNKVCLVTGGSSGIGEAICKLFQENNYLVLNLDIKPGEFGDYHHCDMSKFDEVTRCVEQLTNKYNIDTVILNAGKHMSATIESTSEADFDALFSLNVKGAIATIKAVLPNMKAQNYGNILLISSEQALVAKNNSFAYNLTKTALASIAKTTALDYAQFGIRANAICPGTIETPLYHSAIDRYCNESKANKGDIHKEEAALQPVNRLGQPEEVAEYALFLSSDKAKFITGSLQVIDGGYTTR
ncbi:oxidoreductase [Shewanella sp. OPT22]|nr:oxidoreductase [Shewanella sp. OPT22]